MLRRRGTKNLVIVSMPAKIEKVGQLQELLVEMLPDKRKFQGCISVNTFFEEATNTFHFVEDWESLDDHQAYAAWRGETGGIDVLEPLLEGGAASVKVIICGPEQLGV